jgi:uncharacterized RDD family membrane protein YckC
MWNGAVSVMTETTADDSDDVAGSDIADSVAEPRLLLAPHGRRVWAFVLDLAVVGVLAFIPGGLAVWLFDRATDASGLANLIPLALVLAAALCAYSTATSWLTEGQTPGKAMLGVAVRRRTGDAPSRDLDGLAWAAGRSSVGYVVIDVFGLGMLVGLLTPGRRCLHDYVFGSRVVLLAADVQTTGSEAALARLRAWDERRRASARDVEERYGWLGRLVKWLAWIVTLPTTIVSGITAGKWLYVQLAKLFDRASAEAPSVAPAPAVPAPFTAAIATATTGVTASLAIAAGIAMSTPSIVGTWADGLFQVKRTGADRFVGVYLRDTAAGGCAIPAGQVSMHIAGDGPRYGGELLWYYPGDCHTAWTSTTFTLDSAGRTLDICTTNPENKNDKRCQVSHRD